MPVLKSSGDVRICGDYKLTVNQAAKGDSNPLPHIDELYAKLSGGTVSSKLDLSNSLFMNMSRSNMYKLQKVQNAAAHMIAHL